MAIVNLNKKIFEKEIGKLEENMKEKIALFGTPIDAENEEEIQIEVFPNRPDLLSYSSFKRNFLTFLGKKKGLKEYKIKKPEKNYKVIIDSSVNSVRPFTSCAIIKGLSLNEDKIKEIIEMQEKLHATIGRKRKKLAIGIYPLEQIKLPITYKAIEPDKIKFMPLESEREMTALQILQRHPTGKEYAHLLQGKDKFPVFVDSQENILSLPPIINSQTTGRVTEKTRDVFVECSGFDEQTIRKTLNIVVSSLAEMGGTIYQMQIKGRRGEITPNLNPEKRDIRLENVNRLLGLNLTEKQMKILLEKMGHGYSKGKAEIPAWRTDVLHEVDLIEDIAIAYGYDNFSPEIPEISTIGQENPLETIKRKISEIISGLNILEVSNYHLTNKRDQFEKMGLKGQEKGFVELEQSKTDFTILRKDLTHYALKILSENVDTEYPQRIFEIGKVFKDNGREISEKENLCIALAPGNFTELKQVLDYLGRMLNIEIEIKEPENFPNYYIDGRTAKIMINNKDAGFFGEIHPRTLRNWKIKMPLALLEIDLDEVFNKIA